MVGLTKTKSQCCNFQVKVAMCFTSSRRERYFLLVNDVIYNLNWPYLSPRLGENVPFLVNAVILQVKVATFFTASRQERYFCLVDAVIYKLKWPSFTTLSS